MLISIHSESVEVSETGIMGVITGCWTTDTFGAKTLEEERLEKEKPFYHIVMHFETDESPESRNYIPGITL